MSNHTLAVPSPSRFRREVADQPVAARFESRAALWPEAVAVAGPHGTLTYRQLNLAANRIARRLLLEAESPGTVALFVDQGAPFVAALTGALKAGWCFVPLDPTYPAARNRFMLADSGAAVLLTTTRHLLAASALAPPGVCVRTIDDSDDGVDLGNLDVPVDPDRPAYILYTSGSTGTPKGVVHSHRTILHNAWRNHHALQLGPGDRQSLLYPCSVYGGMRDIFNAVLNGAALHHYDVRARGTSSLAAWLVERRITVYCSVVTIFRNFVRGLRDDHVFPDLRAVKLGGEAPSIRDVELFRSRIGPPTVLHCGLGSTETGMTLDYPVPADATFEGPGVPIGAPVPDVDVRLLDSSGATVPDGEIGEIVIECPYVAIGYHNQPELTRAVFQGEPGQPGRRFFTGDLGVRRADGLFEHRGRRDRQVKIHGNRIELREIEIALEALDGIRDAVVVAHERSGGGLQLTAWLVPAHRPLMAAGELRRQLRGTLSGPMIPTEFRELDRIPLLPNGKVDRHSLQQIASAADAGSRDVVGPRTATERALMEIWSRLLPAPPDSITDDFFALGGHSLIAIEVVAECERRFGVRLPLATLLERSTIDALAEVVDGRSATTFSPLVALKPDGSRRPFFCVHGIGGEALFLKPLASHLDAEQPFYALQADPALRALPPGELIPAMAARYLDAIRTVQPSGPYAIGGYSFGGTVALEMARQLTGQNQDVALLIMFDHSPYHTPDRHATSWPRLAGIVRNLPLWIADDLLRTPPRRMTVRVRGRMRELVRRMAGRTGRPSVEAYFGVSEIPDQTRGFFTAHHHATRAYRPRPYDGDVTLFRGRCEPLLRPRTNDLGWSHLTRGRVSVHRLPGSHANLLREPFVREVARRLCRCLADAPIPADPGRTPAADPR